MTKTQIDQEIGALVHVGVNLQLQIVICRFGNQLYVLRPHVEYHVLIDEWIAFFIQRDTDVRIGVREQDRSPITLPNGSPD